MDRLAKTRRLLDTRNLDSHAPPIRGSSTFRRSSLSRITIGTIPRFHCGFTTQCPRDVTSAIFTANKNISRWSFSASRAHSSFSAALRPVLTPSKWTREFYRDFFLSFSLSLSLSFSIFLFLSNGSATKWIPNSTISWRYISYFMICRMFSLAYALFFDRRGRVFLPCRAKDPGFYLRQRNGEIRRQGVTLDS